MLLLYRPNDTENQTKNPLYRKNSLQYYFSFLLLNKFIIYSQKEKLYLLVLKILCIFY